MDITARFENADALRLAVAGLEHKIVTAKVAALNDAAYVGSRKTIDEMRRVFDRPTPWVLGGVRYLKARKDKPQSQIDFDKWGNKTNVTVEKVLKAEIDGGARRLKRHELALQRVGVLPAGMAIVPGPKAKIDAYGNMASSQIVQIVSWFQGFEQQLGARQNMRDGGKRLGRDNKKTGARGFAYVLIKHKRGKLIPGIYQRFDLAFGSAMKPVMYFVRVPRYQKRFDFYGVAERAATAEFKRAFAGYANQFLRERGL